MIGQGLGPGGSFSLWNRRGLFLKKKSKAASHAMAKRAAQEVSSIAEDIGGCSDERVQVGLGGLYRFKSKGSYEEFHSCTES